MVYEGDIMHTVLKFGLGTAAVSEHRMHRLFSYTYVLDIACTQCAIHVACLLANRDCDNGVPYDVSVMFNMQGMNGWKA